MLKHQKRKKQRRTKFITLLDIGSSLNNNEANAGDENKGVITHKIEEEDEDDNFKIIDLTLEEENMDLLKKPRKGRKKNTEKINKKEEQEKEIQIKKEKDENINMEVEKKHKEETKENKEENKENKKPEEKEKYRKN